jgi:hypothetical protein
MLAVANAFRVQHRRDAIETYKDDRPDYAETFLNRAIRRH